MTTTLDFQTTLDLIRTIVQVVVVAAGAIWGYYRFVRSRTFKLRLEPTVSGIVRNEKHSTYVKISSKLKNVGACKVDVSQTGSAVTILSHTPKATDLGSVLVTYASGIKCLVHNCQRKFADLARSLPHMEIVFADEFFGFEADELDDNVIAHKSLFVLACETFPGLPLCFLVLPLLPAHRRIALFLPLSCICFSMPSASRYLCIGATEPSGWDWPRVFLRRVWAVSARK